VVISSPDDVRCRPDDARRRHLRFEERDPPFELRLLLAQVEQQRIVGIALLAHVAELLPHLPAAYSPQRLKLSTELRVADGGNKHVGVVARSRDALILNSSLSWSLT
jgi:hypothetical protein